MATTNWSIDPTHSAISFKVKHMMFTNVSGKFDNFEAKAVTDGEQFDNAQVSFSAEAASVNTGNADRDKHLVSGDFFDAEQFPKLAFQSTSFQKKGADNYEMKGDLTLHGVTKNIALDVEYGGIGKDPWGNLKAGFTISGKFNRKDFGLNWNAALEAGGVLVSDEVRLNADIQMVKQ